MHVVRELVGTDLLEIIFKNLSVILCKRTELVVSVLEAQICQLHLVDHFLTHLRVDWDVDKLSLLSHLFIVLVLAGAKTLLISVDDDKFTL